MAALGLVVAHALALACDSDLSSAGPLADAGSDAAVRSDAAAAPAPPPIDAATASGAAQDAARGEDAARVQQPDAASAAPDAEQFWSTLCRAADRCGWLGPEPHPELDGNEAECRQRHRADGLPSAELPYMAAMERCVRDASADCAALHECYVRTELQQTACDTFVGCALTDAAHCKRIYTNPPDKFDIACPLYCLESITCRGEGCAADCQEVRRCAEACN